jgi:hypothetical protein
MAPRESRIQSFDSRSVTLPNGSVPWRLLRQDPKSISLSSRGFKGGTEQSRQALEEAAASFITGFNGAIDSRSIGALQGQLHSVAADQRGFAYEGAGMACAILDIITSSRGRRVAALLEGPGDNYAHLIHVGTGWGFARLRLRPWHGLPIKDPMLRWLAWDGWGFHRGFFSPRSTVTAQRIEPRLGGAMSIRDQGLGRSIWFHDCADVGVIAERIRRFDVRRRADLWSGVGLAASYAGGVCEDDLALLGELAGELRAHVVQGIAFAAAARLRSGSLPRHTHSAAEIVAGVSAEVAAGWTEAALAGLNGDKASTYQAWRARVRELWQVASRHVG